MFWNNLIRRYDEWINNSYPINFEALGIYRIIYSLYVLFISGIPNWSWLSDLPDDIYTPPFFSIASLFSGFPDYYLLLSISGIVCVLYILLLFGFKTTFVSILIPTLYFIGNSFLYSRGKIDHTDLFLILIPLVMAFSNWGSSFSIDSNTKPKQVKPSNSWPVTLMSLLIGFAFFSAGLPKLLGGWLNLNTHGVKGIFYNYYYTQGHQNYLASFFLEIQNDLFWETLDYLTVFFEVSFLFTIIIPTIFRFYIYIAIIFHMVIFLMLNIIFSDNLVAYLLFINWNIVLRFLEKFRVVEIVSYLPTYSNMIIFSIIMVSYFFFIGSSPFIKFLEVLDLDPSIVLLSIGTLVATINFSHYLRMKLRLHLHPIINKSQF